MASHDLSKPLGEPSLSGTGRSGLAIKESLPGIITDQGGIMSMPSLFIHQDEAFTLQSPTRKKPMILPKMSDNPTLRRNNIKPQPADKDVAYALEKVRLVDFSPIRQKLGHISHGAGMSRTDIVVAQLLYEAYLSLLIAFKGNCDITLAPPHAADKFWHYHILDTRKYMKDCQFLFGEYLHHYPYFGMRDEQDEKNLLSAGKQTMDLMTRHFYDVEGFEPIYPILQESRYGSCIGSCSMCKAIHHNSLDSRQINGMII